VTHRILLLGGKAQEEIDATVAFALQPENLYSLERDYPSSDERHVVRLFQDFVCIFSITTFPGTEHQYRHLSITIAPPGKPPRMEFVVTIAKAFGFTGYEPEREPSMLPPWDIGPCPDGCCAVVVQALEA
jgi:hypothetical protein